MSNYLQHDGDQIAMIAAMLLAAAGPGNQSEADIREAVAMARVIVDEAVAAARVIVDDTAPRR